MKPQSNARLSKALDALYTAHEFIDSVTAWQGHEDDHAEALHAVGDAIELLEGENRAAA